jgi:putative MATE family efflux protein
MENNEVATAPIGKLLLKYSIPGIIGMMVTALYNVVDRIYIGQIPNIGSLAISGVGATLPITTIVLAFSMLVGMGATANISIFLGKKQKKDAEGILGNAVSMSIFFSLLITIIGVLFTNQILSSFGASNDLLPFAREYIIIILAGTIFNLTSFSINNTIRADGSPVVAGVIMGIGCVINIVLDSIFIFTFNMGIRGAAIATVISQVVTTALIGWYYLSGRSYLKISLKTLKPNFKYIGIIIAIGLSPFSMQIATSVVQIVLNNRLRDLGGDIALGAFAIIVSIWMIFMMPVFGINQGGQPIIGYNYGARQFARVRKTLLIITGVGTLYLTLGFLIIQFFPEALIGFFNKDQELVKIATEGIRTNLFTLPLLSICVMGSTFFQNIGKAKISIFLSLMRQVLLLIPAIIIFSDYLGLRGVWIAQPICDAISTVTIIIFVLFELKKQKEMQQEEVI